MSNTSKPKVYHGVLEEIRNYIRENNLSPGDKLPSERELVETLKAGRSSVREALRALELLGLIETRHGEGTFLRNYRSLQSVELLSSFILFEDRTKQDLLETKRLIEKEATKLAFHQMDENDIEELHQTITKEIKPEDRHIQFYNLLFAKTGNQLLFKIWMLIEEFSRSINKSHDEVAFYEEIVEMISKRDYATIETFYESRTLLQDKK